MFRAILYFVLVNLLTATLGAVSSDTLQTTATAQSTSSALVIMPSHVGDLAADSRVLRYEFAPPLSLNDTIYMVRASIFRLEHAKSGSINLDREKIDQEIRAVINYVKLLDNRYYTLRDYNWIQLGDNRISMNNPDWDRFNPPLAIKDVSALALRVEKNDVRLLDLEIWEMVEGKKQLVPLELDFKVIQHSKPSADVIFLNRRIRLIQIRSKAEVIKPDQEARLIIKAGITQKPEHAKYANRELETARKLIQQEKDIQALQCLRQAWRELLKLRHQSQL